MAYSYVWPASLPQNVFTDYSETRGALFLRSPMDAGPAKIRKRGKRPDTLSVSFAMSQSQLGTLDTFINSTIKYTARFGFPHPRLRTLVECRIVPQEDGQSYSIEYLALDRWKVSMELEVLP